VDHIAEELDKRLDRRGLSLREIRGVTDINNDGKVDLEEVRETAKLAVGQLVASQAESWAREQEEKWREATKNLVTRDEEAGLKGDVADFWAWLKATMGALFAAIVTYLTKQVFSAKSDGKRDVEIAKGAARQDMLEKMLGRDLDGDGDIGGEPTSEA
jgi:DNA-binding transcriptional MerR regulator